MPGLDGTGPRGMGPMTGGGRGFCSPRGIGAALRGRFVPPYPTVPYAPYRGLETMPYRASAPWTTPFSPQMTHEQELDFLRSEAHTTRQQLERIDARINELTAEG